MVVQQDLGFPAKMDFSATFRGGGVSGATCRNLPNHYRFGDFHTFGTGDLGVVTGGSRAIFSLKYMPFTVI